MKLSTKARYGLRATTELALRKVAGNGSTRPVPLSTIAKRQGIPEQYLRQIFLLLKRAGIVKAVRGKRGGYLLGREPEAIAALDVVWAMGERLEPQFPTAELVDREKLSELIPGFAALTEAERDAVRRDRRRHLQLRSHR